MMAVLSRLASALALAAKAHDGQKYGDEDYIWHPIRVALALHRRGYDEDTVIAGLFHDVPEDTDVTLGQIAEGYGARVADMVAGMTKAKGQDNGDYIRAMPFESVPIKLEDTFENFLGLSNLSEGPRKVKLTERYLRNIAHLSDRLAYEGRLPKLTKRERMAVALAKETYPDGWGQAA